MRRAWLPLFAVVLSSCPKADAGGGGSNLESQLEKEVLACHDMERILQDRASNCLGGGNESDPMYTELSQVVVTREVKVSHTGAITQVVLPESHLFGSDGLSIRDEAKGTLDLLATALKEHNQYTIVVEGNTADEPLNAAVGKRWPDPWDLGFARATAVMRVLVDQFKVAPERFTLSSRGPNAPIASNDTPPGQAENRRVVVYIYPPDLRK